MSVDVQQFIQFIFVALAFLLAGASLGQTHTRWLGVLFLMVGLHGALARLDPFAGTVAQRFSYAVALGYGPVFYLFLRGLLRQEGSGWLVIMLALSAPAAGAILISAGVTAQAGFGFTLTLVQLAAIVASWRELHIYGKTMDFARAAGEPSGLVWLWSALGLYSALVFAQSVRALLAPGMPAGVRAAVDIAVAVGFALILAMFALQILRKPGWIPRLTANERALALEPDQSPQPPTTAQQALHQELETFFRNQRPYLDPELSLQSLAAQLGWPTRQLSEVINRVDGCSFSHRINALRVDEAKRLISGEHKEARTLLDIALAAGFNSKSVFNLMFKRHAGLTPTQFRRQNPKKMS